MPRTAAAASLLRYALAPIALAACAGTAPPRTDCGPPADSVVATAVAEYIAKLTPRPHRFVVPIGTDSTLPDLGREALQAKGPTYLFPTDGAQQAKLLEQLAKKGNWITLLVAYGGIDRVDRSRAVVRLTGHYLGGEVHGMRAPPRGLRFDCTDGRWQFQSAEETRTT